MSEEVDSFIDSNSFSDQRLLDLLSSGQRVSSLTLVRYLSKGVVNASSAFVPKTEVVRELINAGATPFHFSQRHEWKVLFANDIRFHMPVALRSTINLAALIRNREVIKLLVEAGEDPNRYTNKFLEVRFR